MTAVGVAGFDISDSGSAGDLEVLPARSWPEMSKGAVETATGLTRRGCFARNHAEVGTGRQSKACQLGRIDYARAVSVDHEVECLGVLLG
jgi:hypothetical protein